MSIQKILLIQLRRIGDVLMTTPSIRALRRAYPDAHITFVTEAPSDQVLQNNPYLDEVLLFSRKNSFWEYLRFLWRLYEGKFDIVIDFFGNPRSAQMSWSTRAKLRIGFDFPGRRLYYTDRIPLGVGARYAAQHKSLLLQRLDIVVDSFKLDFYIHEDDRKYVERLFHEMEIQEGDVLVTLSPVSRQPYKVWPPQHFAKIADQLIEKLNAKILFIYGPGEETFVDQVRQSMSYKALPNYPPPTLGQTKAIFEKTTLHLGNDNGPCHFAIAAGTPTVAVFGKPKAINWTPPNQQAHRAVEYDPGCKQQCTYPACTHLNCIKGVSPKVVETEVFDLIRGL